MEIEKVNLDKEVATQYLAEFDADHKRPDTDMVLVGAAWARSADLGMAEENLPPQQHFTIGDLKKIVNEG